MLTDSNRELPKIIARAQAGDPAAFAEIYARYASQVLRYLYARLREPEAAQDLTQEVFVRVLKGIGGFEYRGEKSFLGWLYTIAGNVLIGQVRRRTPVSTPLDEGMDIVDPRGQDVVHALFDRMALQQAIEQLTDDQQQVLTLKFFADMSNTDIARLIGRTEGAVKALQHRALQALQQILDQEAQEARQREAALDGVGAQAELDDATLLFPPEHEGARLAANEIGRTRRARRPFSGS
jgi:RNA polymerase sigma-70 factor (ECF subfamily)